MATVTVVVFMVATDGTVVEGTSTMKAVEATNITVEAVEATMAVAEVVTMAEEAMAITKEAGNWAS